MKNFNSTMQAFDQHGIAIPGVLAADDLPSEVHGVEYLSARRSLRNFESLASQERALVTQAVDRRKADFGDARWCAHQALAAGGFPNAAAPILKGQRGMPVFPSGSVGSMTHTDGYRGALVGDANRWKSLGIDAEPTVPLPKDVFDAIALPQENARGADLAKQLGESHHAAGLLDLVLFSAKEATYKAWFPLTHRFLDFDQADIVLRSDGSFTSYILASPTPVPLIEGQWLVRQGFAITMTAVPR